MDILVKDRISEHLIRRFAWWTIKMFTTLTVDCPYSVMVIDRLGAKLGFGY